jgi:hypothetical protein
MTVGDEGTVLPDVEVVTHTDDIPVHVATPSSDVTLSADEPVVIADPVEDTQEPTDLPDELVGHSVEPVPAAVVEDDPVAAGTENEAEKPVKEVEEKVKPDKRPNRKLGWRALILGGSGGTK